MKKNKERCSAKKKLGAEYYDMHKHLIPPIIDVYNMAEP
jgi:hypothetical protein